MNRFFSEYSIQPTRTAHISILLLYHYDCTLTGADPEILKVVGVEREGGLVGKIKIAFSCAS